jgi:hypothetical protein
MLNNENRVNDMLDNWIDDRTDDRIDGMIDNRIDNGDNDYNGTMAIDLVDNTTADAEHCNML